MAKINKKINLLYIVTKLEIGGAQKQLLSIIRGLDQKRFNLFLYTAKDAPLLEEAQAIPGLMLFRCRFLERPINPFKDLFAFISLRSFIIKNSIDITHTHSSKAGILGRLAASSAGIKQIIHTVHGWSFNDYQPAPLRFLYIWLERVCANFTHKIIVVSEHDLAKGLNFRIGSREKYQLVRYGIEAEDFKHKFVGNVSNSYPTVTMVACFKKQKYPLDFVRLARLIKNDLPDVRYVLAGDGRLRSSISRLIKRFGLTKEFTLTGWSSDIPKILSDSSVFVLTSLWEGLPVSVLEAMAAGVPVVATDTGGIREVIDCGKTGFLAEPQDVKAMHSRVIELLRNTQLARQIAQNARSVIARGDFSREKMVESIQGFYTDYLCQ